LEQTRTGGYAWALIPNYFHLLLRTGGCAVSHHDAPSFDQPRGHQQPPAPAKQPSVPESLQIHFKNGF